VGVTGHRPKRLRDNNADMDTLRLRARTVLDAVATGVAQLRDDDPRPSPYANEPALLRLVSPLAEGSDRLVAQAALDVTPIPYELQCVFPFPVDMYREDFRSRSEWELQGSAAEFDRLHAHASATLELDSDPTAENAYVAVGLTLVRQCDVLLAIWDAARARGPGGTPEIVLEALRANIPVVAIDARGAENHRIAFLELRHGRIEWITWSTAELARKLRTVFILPTSPEPHEHDSVAPQGKVDLAHALFEEPVAPAPATTLYARVTRWAARLTGEAEFQRLLTPELRHFVQQPPAQGGAESGHEGLLSREVRRDVAPPHHTPALRALVARLEATLGAAYSWTDLQADRYAALNRRHIARSTLLLVPIAIVLGYVVQRCLSPNMIGDSFRAATLRVGLSVIELAAVLWIFDSYVTVREHRYHDRWLDYRSVAEKLRHILMLLPLGRTGIDAELPPTLGANDVRSHWTNWYIRAVTREAGVFSGKLHDPEYRQACHTLLRHWLVRGQIRYHYYAAIRAHAPMHVLHKYRYLIFVCVVLSPIVDLVLEPIPQAFEHGTQLAECLLELVFFCVPAVLGSYYAFTRLGDFENIEVRARAELQRLIAVDRELSEHADQSSVDLVRAASMTSHAMLAELVEWRVAAALREPDLGH
jgi:hypothetical protein